MADLPELLDVQEEGARVGLANVFPQDVHPFPRTRLKERWAAEIAGENVGVYVVVPPGGRIAGFAAIRGNELLHFGTALHTWGSGLAAAVHGELLEATPRRTRSTFPPYPVLMEYERPVTDGRASAGGTSS